MMSIFLISNLSTWFHLQTFRIKRILPSAFFGSGTKVELLHLFLIVKIMSDLRERSWENVSNLFCLLTATLPCCSSSLRHQGHYNVHVGLFSLPNIVIILSVGEC